MVHYKNLKQYLEEGMILKKVHRGIKFHQSNWMGPYIRKNTDLRKLANNSFKKDFFKLMNNSVFGKTIEISENDKMLFWLTTKLLLSNYHQNQNLNEQQYLMKI